MKIYGLIVLIALALLASCSSPLSPANSGNAGRALLAAGPDLTITDVRVVDFTANSIQYSYTVVNSGTVALNQADIVVQGYISADQAVNGGDSPAGGTILNFTGQILPGESVLGSFASNVAPGTIHPETATQYLLLTVSDNQVTETNPNNNLGSVQILPKLPDLIVTNVQVLDYTSNSIQYSYTISNIGSVAANKADIAVQAYVSADTVINGGDAAAGGSLLDISGQLLPGESVNGSFSSGVVGGTVHPETATQYLLIMVDNGNQVAEQNENNNLGYVQIPIILPDLLISNVTLTTSGNSYSSHFTVTNAGNKVANTTNVVMQAYISNGTPFNHTYPAGGFVLGPFGTTQILPGQSVDFSWASNLPANWYNRFINQYLLLTIDAGNAVLESNENNNATSTLIHRGLIIFL